MVKPKPENYRTLCPYIIVADGDAAVAFYKRVFGATLRLRLPRPDGRIGHAELQIGDSVLMLADEAPQHQAYAPARDDRHSVGLHVYVDDVDAVVGAAEAAGAAVIARPETKFYGDRAAAFRDPFGHMWYPATHVEDVTPEEIERRANAMFGGGGSQGGPRDEV